MESGSLSEAPHSVAEKSIWAITVACVIVRLTKVITRIKGRKDEMRKANRRSCAVEPRIVT